MTDTSNPGSNSGKLIRLTKHAQEQCTERGASEAEVIQAVRRGTREPAKKVRFLYRYNFEYSAVWQSRRYAVEQVAPVIVEEPEEIVVITVCSSC